MRQDYEQDHPEKLKRMTTQVVYSNARDKRKYRQAHVMKHWDDMDRRILFSSDSWIFAQKDGDRTRNQQTSH